MSNVQILEIFFLVIVCIWFIVAASYMLYCKIKYGDFGGRA